MDDPILAIDLGKSNSVCCWYEPASKGATFRSLARKLLIRCWAILKTGQPWRNPLTVVTPLAG